METTLALPQDLHNALEAIARRTGRDRAAVLVEALRDYVARQDQPRPRSIKGAGAVLAHGDERRERTAAARRSTEDWEPGNDGNAATSTSEAREAESNSAHEWPGRRLRSLGFAADEVGLHAEDIDAYLAAQWRPEAAWRDEPGP